MARRVFSAFIMSEMFESKIKLEIVGHKTQYRSSRILYDAAAFGRSKEKGMCCGKEMDTDDQLSGTL